MRTIRSTRTRSRRRSAPTSRHAERQERRRRRLHDRLGERHQRDALAGDRRRHAASRTANEVQEIDVVNADDGSSRLGFGGAVTSPLNCSSPQPARRVDASRRPLDALTSTPATTPSSVSLNTRRRPLHDHFAGPRSRQGRRRHRRHRHEQAEGRDERRQRQRRELHRHGHEPAGRRDEDQPGRRDLRSRPSPTATSTTNEVQQLVVKATGGTYTLSFGGQTTADTRLQRQRGGDPDGARGAVDDRRRQRRRLAAEPRHRVPRSPSRARSANKNVDAARRRDQLGHSSQRGAERRPARRDRRHLHADARRARRAARSPGTPTRRRHDRDVRPAREPSSPSAPTRSRPAAAPGTGRSRSSRARSTSTSSSATAAALENATAARDAARSPASVRPAAAARRRTRTPARRSSRSSCRSQLDAQAVAPGPRADRPSSTATTHDDRRARHERRHERRARRTAATPRRTTRRSRSTSRRRTRSPARHAGRSRSPRRAATSR